MSKPLYAIPDHEAVLGLLPEGFARHLQNADAAERLRHNRSILPIAIDPRGPGRILWADIGQHDFRESKFLSTVRRLAEAGLIGETFSSEIDLLDHEELFADGLKPAGLIFHSSRCGSTLLTKTLARPQGNMMISQGGPLQRGFWAYATDEWRHDPEPRQRVVARLGTLVRAMTRPRSGEKTRAFVKFISWNVLYFDLISEAFPDVPAIFLYREPADVIARVKRETTAVLLARGSRQAAFLTGLSPEATLAMGDADYLAACYARYFETVLAKDRALRCLNYRDLKPTGLSHILHEGLRYPATDSEMAEMRDQFAIDSKDDRPTPRPFTLEAAAREAVPLSREERAAIAARCAELVGQLDSDSKNLFPCRRATLAEDVDGAVTVLPLSAASQAYGDGDRGGRKEMEEMVPRRMR